VKQDIEALSNFHPVKYGDDSNNSVSYRVIYEGNIIKVTDSLDEAILNALKYKDNCIVMSSLTKEVIWPKEEYDTDYISEEEYVEESKIKKFFRDIIIKLKMLIKK
jgi:hypothetical protein